MKKSDILEALRNTALMMFPGHVTSNYYTFSGAKTRYFQRLKPLEVRVKVSIFNDTYYSSRNVSWFILGEYKYFSIVYQPGLNNSCSYYGIQKK